MGSQTVYIVDDCSRNRARVSRAVMAVGHHAEIYSSFDEFGLTPPQHGVIMAGDAALGGELTRISTGLRRQGHWLGFIVTSADPSIEKAVDAMRSGATDYLPLPVEGPRLGRAIEHAADSALRSCGKHAKWNAARECVAKLTRREAQVLGMVAEGLTNRAIGLRLGLSDRTIETHRNNAFNKMDSHSTAEAIIGFSLSKEMFM